MTFSKRWTTASRSRASHSPRRGLPFGQACGSSFSCTEIFCKASRPISANLRLARASRLRPVSSLYEKKKRDLARVLTRLKVAMMGQVYKRLAESFYPLLVVFYHYQFRTKKSLELSLDWLKTPQYPAAACHSRAIREAAQYLLDSRKEHCKLLLKQLKPFYCCSGR